MAGLRLNPFFRGRHVLIAISRVGPSQTSLRKYEARRKAS